MDINIKDLTVSVGNKTVLNKLNLNIKQGEVHAIMGPNGVGKSTLSKVIMGDPTYKIESGDILVSNVKMPKLKYGDILCVFNTGSYNYSMASNYNRTQKPAMVLVNSGHSDMILKRETLDDLIRNDIIPKRLKKC